MLSLYIRTKKCTITYLSIYHLSPSLVKSLEESYELISLKIAAVQEYTGMQDQNTKENNYMICVCLY